MEWEHYKLSKAGIHQDSQTEIRQERETDETC